MGIGNVTTTYSEFTFKEGEFIFHYVGQWQVEISGGVLTSSTSAEGTYNKVVIDRDGQPYATLFMDEQRSVDFGKS